MNKSISNVEEGIIEVISNLSNIPKEKLVSHGRDGLLFTGGLGLDSFNAVELIFELEQRFDIEFSDDEISLKNIDSIDKIEKLVRKKTK